MNILTLPPEKTSAPAAAPATDHSAAPEFIRLPVRRKCPYTGLSRAKLYQLISPCAENQFRPPVKSVSLRTPGAVKGVRLIHYASLLGYLHSLGNEAA